MDKAYGLPRDQAESSRLDTQHVTMGGSAGYLLHPRVRSSLEGRSDVRVADVATGTGIWLLDVADAFPQTWRFTGLDMSDAQFPSTEKISGYGSRVDFQVFNLLEPPPEQLRGAFDVVPLRLLVCGLKTPDWQLAAGNVLLLLKPGGWIQWQEINAPSLKFFANEPDAPVDAGVEMHRQAVRGQQRLQKFMDEDCAKLAERVASVGFEACNSHKFSSDRRAELRHAGSWAIHGAMAGMLRWSVHNDPDIGLSADEVEVLISNAAKELENDKTYLQWEMRCVTGRKPS